MKPRLEPAPYTDEDRDIWVCVGLWPAFALNDKLELASAIGDRRDADLMFFAQHIRSCTFPVALPPLWVPSLDGPQRSMLCGGALAEWRTLNLGHFA